MVHERKISLLLATLIALVIILLAAVTFLIGMIYNRMGGNRSMTQMMSSSGMMNGMMGNSSNMNEMMNEMMPSPTTKPISNVELKQLVQQSENGATIDKASKTVTYTGNDVNLVAQASPSGAPDMTWNIDGLVNPTIVVPSGATVRITTVNTDWGDWHGFEVTTTPPPYSQMPMMSINNNFFLPPVIQRTTQSLKTAEYYTRTGQLSLTTGTYYYLCPVPGHAQQGMHGVLKVS